MSIKVNFLKAFNGDAIYISYKVKGKKKNILIDGGVPRTYMHNPNGRPTYGELKTEVVDNLSDDEKIDLLIITHWDNDHIGGIIKWFEEDETAKDKIGKIWFNGGLLINEYFDTNHENSNKYELDISDSPFTSSAQGIYFEDIIAEYGLWNEQLVKVGQTAEDEDIKFTILSPTDVKLEKLLKEWEKSPNNPYTSCEKDYDKTIDELMTFIDENKFKEDSTVHNGSSIAFILEIDKKKMLFLGDSHPSVICESLINLGEPLPLKVDFLKVSHHGSRGNTSDELLDMIDCNNFVLLADGTHKGLPHKETLVRIMKKKNGCNFYFNYSELIENIFDSEMDDSRFEAKSILDLKL